MKINKECSDGVLTLQIEGRLDTVTAPELEGELAGSLDGVNEQVLDFSKLEYISSAGLRVLLAIKAPMPSSTAQSTPKSAAVFNPL